MAAGASKKPYGLRNTNGGASSSSYEHQDRLPQDRLGGSTGAAKARGGGDDAGIGMGTMRQQSQASLIDMREGAGAMGGLPQQAGSSLMTPFGNQGTVSLQSCQVSRGCKDGQEE